MYSTFQQSYILYSEIWQTDIPHYLLSILLLVIENTCYPGMNIMIRTIQISLRWGTRYLLFYIPDSFSLAGQHSIYQVALCKSTVWKHQTQIIAIFIWKYYMLTFTDLILTLWTCSDYKYLDYISLWMYTLSHFGLSLLCNSNPDAEDG